MKKLRSMMTVLLIAVAPQVMGQTAEQDSMRAVFNRLFYQNCYAIDRSAQVSGLKQHFPNVEDIKLEMALYEVIVSKVYDACWATVQEKMTLDELRVVEKEWSDKLYNRLNAPLPMLQTQESIVAPVQALVTGKATANEIRPQWEAQHTITDARYKDVIEKYMAANTSSIKAIASSMQQLTSGDAQAKELIKTIMQLSVDATMEQAARYYKPEEIERMTAFYSSETGKKYMECFVDKVQELSTQIAQEDLKTQYEKAIASFTPQQIAEFAAKRARYEQPWCEPIENNAEIAWADGTYKGEVFNGKPHGVGTYTNQKGEKFMGFYSYGLRNGLILHTKKDKTMQECWINDVQVKEGTKYQMLKPCTGKIVTINGKVMLEAIIATTDGNTYGWGTFNDDENGLLSGSFNGKLFKGDVRIGGTTIKGTMYDGNLVGPYTFVTKQGSTTIIKSLTDKGIVILSVQGSSNDYKMAGFGRFDDDCNFTGEGAYKSGDLSLNGLFYNGDIIEGTVKQGDYHYVGEMKEGLVRHGKGTIFDEKGNPRYHGSWSSDQLHGDDCTVFLEDGMVKGKCVYGKMISGTVTLNNGKTFPLKETMDFRFK